MGWCASIAPIARKPAGSLQVNPRSEKKKLLSGQSARGERFHVLHFLVAVDSGRLAGQDTLPKWHQLGNSVTPANDRWSVGGGFL
jgi:hypothetical protein